MTNVYARMFAKLYICTCMCARMANLCVRTFVQLNKHVCVYLYNVYMHVCVRLAKLMDQAEKILQLQVNSSCSGTAEGLSQCNHVVDVQVLKL